MTLSVKAKKMFFNERKSQQQEDEMAKKSLAVYGKNTPKSLVKVANSHDMQNQYAKVKNTEKRRKRLKETKSRSMIMLMNSLKKLSGMLLNMNMHMMKNTTIR
jgi:hypothetical protein